MYSIGFYKIAVVVLDVMILKMASALSSQRLTLWCILWLLEDSELSCSANLVIKMKTSFNCSLLEIITTVVLLI